MVARHARVLLLLMCATVAASGCKAVGPNSVLRQGSANTLPPTMTVQDAVAAINQNALGIKSVQANTTITASLGGRRPFAVPLKGDLLMERERNFRLSLRTTMMGEVADIGSNDHGFWFWVKDNDHAIYTCKYDANGQIPAGVPVTLQPDWIVEALGLREISDTDAATMTISRGKHPVPNGRSTPTDVLHGRLQTAGGDTFYRVIVLNSATKRIVGYGLYAPDGKTLIAEAEPEYEITDTVASGPSLPRRVTLRWVKEQIELDVALKRVQLNPSFDRNRADAFTEPDMPGFERRDLAALAGGAGNGSQTQIRESRPIPPAGSRRSLDGAASRVRLGEPTPIGLDGAAIQRNDPRPLEPALPPLPAASNDSIRSPIPTAPTDAGTAAVAAQPGPPSGMIINH